MDVKRWNLVLYEWVRNLMKIIFFTIKIEIFAFSQIKATKLTDVTGSLDQVNLKEFFVKYNQRVSSNGEADIVEFLHCKFRLDVLLILLTLK